VELPSFSCLWKDTKVIWKILFLLWDKLLSSHLVVNYADCDSPECKLQWVLDRDQYAGQINQSLDSYNKQESLCGFAD